MIKEAFFRLWQIIFGVFIFDFPVFMLLRTLAYKPILSTEKGAVLSSHILLYAPHKFNRHQINAGSNLQISENVRIDVSRPITIGDGVWISEGSQIFSHSHVGNTYERVEQKKMELHPPLIIGDGAWIGAGSKIMPKVTYIGEGAIIGAGSIVTRNVDDFAVVAGNPAKVLKIQPQEVKH